ncbi:hypothetical protein CYG48_03045 [Neorhizobium sp. SOG26]|uniref:HVO_A0114 family putative DNA-binding protein n=1 Tax=Neorhizobium sp. SOG26 TaxID=2060726 RepID=UPI000E56FA88|nr:hypothetical protein [Neorhizobium sp. SOG26]AXV14768.1 hypothetical protein CYG48_03045 [Neorhizobium sp. SOG26]
MSEVRLHVTDMDNFFSDAATAAAAIDGGEEGGGASAIGFESMDLLLKVLTPNRWRLLRALKGDGASSIRKLSATLGRDYRGVHADVTALLAAGLIEKESGGLVHVPWDKITVEMAFSEAA